jgi:hypothetical protein
MRRQDDGLVVGLLELVDHRHGGAYDRRGGRIVLRRLVVVDPPHVPDHRVGVELRAVVELHTLPHLADPAQRVGLVGVPCSEQAWRDVSQLVGVGEVPVDDGIVGRVAEKSEPLAAVVGNAVRCGQVRRGHADAQDLRAGGECRHSGKHRGTCRRSHEATPGEHRAIHSLSVGRRRATPLPVRRRRARSCRPSRRYRSRRRTRAPSPTASRCARRR